MNEFYTSTNSERPRNVTESFKHLNSLLRKVSDDIAETLKKRYGMTGLISEDCSIKMKAFRELNREMNEEDTEKVKEAERKWSGAGNPETRKLSIQRYGLPEDAKDTAIVSRYLEERAKEKSHQLEMLITILLHKAFGNKYIVVRSAKYDDYFGGVDNVIVNKETGDVICAFDEVRENERSNRREEKDDKVLEKARQGGAEIIYGFSTQGGKIKLQSMSNLPLFCLGLDGDEYDELVEAIQYDGRGGDISLNAVEQKFLDKIIDSIREQKERLLADADVQKNDAIVANLNKVDELLEARG